MSEILEAIRTLWPIIITLFLALIWIVRLESDLRNLKIAVSSMEKKQNANEDAVWKKLNELSSEISQLGKTLSRIEGKLEVTLDSKH